MNKEDAIKYLKQLYPNGGHCWLDDQRMEAIGMAVKALQEEPVSGLDNGNMPIERWEQAVKAASNQRNYRSSKGLTETRDDYFVDGVQWADEHPKEEPASADKMIISKEWFEHCKKSWYNEGYIDGEYNRDRQFEDSVSEDLEDAAIEICSKVLKGETTNFDGYEYVVLSDAEECFKAGAKWQEEKDNICYEEIFEEGAEWKAYQFEKERLKQCNNLTKEQAKIEQDFVVNFIKNNNCTPTFIDAIEYGKKLKLKDGK